MRIHFIVQKMSDAFLLDWNVTNCLHLVYTQNAKLSLRSVKVLASLSPFTETNERLRFCWLQGDKHSYTIQIVQRVLSLLSKWYDWIVMLFATEILHLTVNAVRLISHASWYSINLSSWPGRVRAGRGTSKKRNHKMRMLPAHNHDLQHTHPEFSKESMAPSSTWLYIFRLKNWWTSMCYIEDNYCHRNTG